MKLLKSLVDIVIQNRFMNTFACIYKLLVAD